MVSFGGKAVGWLLRNFASVNPVIVERKKQDVIKSLRSTEWLFKPYIPPFGYTLEKHDADGLSIELFRKKNSDSKNLVFVLHGGAYVTRMTFYYRWMNRLYSKASGGGSVIHFDYRCQPEFTFPSALDDAVKAWDWALDHGFTEENTVTVGDSAGAHLNVNLLMKLHDTERKMPKAAVCMSPWLDMSCKGASYKANYGVDPIFGEKNGTLTDELFSKLINCKLFEWFGNRDRTDPYVSPVYAEFDGKYPPMLITAGGNELLLDDAQTLADKLKKAGVPVIFDVTPGMYHVFNLYRLFPESKRAINLMTAFINDKLCGRLSAPQEVTAKSEAVNA